MEIRRARRWLAGGLQASLLLFFTTTSFAAAENPLQKALADARPFGPYQVMVEAIGWGRFLGFFICYTAVTFLLVWLLSKKMRFQCSNADDALNYTAYLTAISVVGPLLMFIATRFVTSPESLVAVAFMILLISLGLLILAFYAVMRIFGIGILKAFGFMIILGIVLGVTQICLGLAFGCAGKTPIGASINASTKRAGVTVFHDTETEGASAEAKNSVAPAATPPPVVVPATPPPSPLQAKYNELLAARSKLDANDPAAVEKFNILVAEYNEAKAKAAATPMPVVVHATPTAAPSPSRHSKAR